MATDRICVSKEFRESIDKLREKDVLGIRTDITENKEIFMLAVALGLETPKPLKNRDGYFLNTAIKTTDKAVIAAVLLGTASPKDELDEYANFEKSALLCEKCAESGYQELLKLYDEAEQDEELLEKNMIKKLEWLYLKNVENNI